MTTGSTTRDLTAGPITSTMLRFAGPMILGNLLQQCYNLADTFIVGRFLGADALAAAGSAYTLMTFLNSVLIGLCMGSGSLFSMCFGRGDTKALRSNAVLSFAGIGALALAVQTIVSALLEPILNLLQVPQQVWPLMRDYVRVIFFGIVFVFLYNYFSFLLRAVGNSVAPLCFLAVAALGNIALDLLFVVGLHGGIAGAAWATVLAQAVSGVGLGVYTWLRCPELHPVRQELQFTGQQAKTVLWFSAAACVQQSVMNFGILMVQGLVNSFGTAVMAAFAAGVKIDSFAYMPAQEFGNAYSLFTSQNYGARRQERVKQGTRSAILLSMVFCVVVSVLVFAAAPWLIQIFVDGSEAEIIAIGAGYLRIEGAFYCGIGLLFLWYGYYRGIGRPEMSLVLTVISLGTRVVLAYALAPTVGVTAIWWAVPIGWALADAAGAVCYPRLKGK